MEIVKNYEILGITTQPVVAGCVAKVVLQGEIPLRPQLAFLSGCSNLFCHLSA